MVNRKGCAILALALTLAAAVPAAAQTADPAAPRPWRAMGNEPSWVLTRTPQTLTLVTEMGARTVSAQTPKPHRLSARTVRYAASAQGRPLRVTVVRRVCADTMSGMPHPETVTVRFGGRTYKGCGGEPASLLAGDAWRVVKVGDTAVKPPAQVTMRFGADGRVAGKGGCNQYNAAFVLTGEGLTFEKGLSTMMACEQALMDLERDFLARLEKVARFSMTDERHLVLHTADGSVIAAERVH